MKKGIIGLGNALADVLINIESDGVIGELSFERGSMNLVGRDVHEKISSLTTGANISYMSGGSAANTVRGLARLGVRTGYIGKIGQDTVGVHIEKEFAEHEVEYMLMRSGNPTGQCMVLVSADGERTMATYLGAAVELEGHEITPADFNGYGILHIEGYLVQNHALIRDTVKKAKAEGLIISLDMASFNVVEENKEFLRALVDEYVDIVFANEDEAKSFTGLEPEEALHEMAGMCNIAVVKLGGNGSLIKSGGEVFRIAAGEADVVDTTGAGDLYASGFLYGLINGLSIGESGRIGSLVASKVIEETGPAISPAVWPEIRTALGLIMNPQ